MSLCPECIQSTWCREWRVRASVFEGRLTKSGRNEPLRRRKTQEVEPLTIQPSGKKRILKTPAHGLLQLFAAQNFTILKKF